MMLKLRLIWRLIFSEKGLVLTVKRGEATTNFYGPLTIGEGKTMVRLTDKVIEDHLETLLAESQIEQQIKEALEK